MTFASLLLTDVMEKGRSGIAWWSFSLGRLKKVFAPLSVPSDLQLWEGNSIQKECAFFLCVIPEFYKERIFQDNIHINKKKISKPYPLLMFFP